MQSSFSATESGPPARTVRERGASPTSTVGAGGADEVPVLMRAVVAGKPQWCVRSGADLRAFRPGTSLGSLLGLSAVELRTLVEQITVDGLPVQAERVTAPVDGDTEIWAAGVTYDVSRTARTEESRESTMYERVYDADRPELFFKSVGWRVAGPGDPIGVREDSAWNVPEPELAIVANATGQIVGFTICNDVSSRSIEAENPLYLPQAKCFRGGCAVGPWIVPAWGISDPYALDIVMDIERAHTSVWSGSTSTTHLHRRLEELTGCLFQGDVFPRGVILSTGTAAVPSDDFTLIEGDTVSISIGSVGTLRNPVLSGARGPQWDSA